VSTLLEHIGPSSSAPPPPLREARTEFEVDYLRRQLEVHHGNISAMASAIGMDRAALSRKLTKLGFTHHAFRSHPQPKD
jgi:DNA-binding NtrC family response regulator